MLLPQKCDGNTDGTPDKIGQHERNESFLNSLLVRLVILQCENIPGNNKQHGYTKAQQRIGYNIFQEGSNGKLLLYLAERLQVGFIEIITVHK